MATRATVEPKIIAIEDNGSNTASEVRDVLTELLNFADEGLIQTNTRISELEKKPGGTGIKPFHFWNPNEITDPKGALLWYSFKGFEEQFVNLTFKIIIKESEVHSLNFTLNEQDIIFDILSKMIDPRLLDPENQDQLDFIVKIKNTNEKIIKKFGKKFRVGSMSLKMNKEITIINIESQELGDNLSAGDELFSSITLHCPEFKF